LKPLNSQIGTFGTQVTTRPYRDGVIVADFSTKFASEPHFGADLHAKARGVAFGRPRKMRPDQQQVARELVRDGKSISAVARTFDVHPATIYRVIGG
jgi:DNA invertase Pin-like site-specific DNA recombinase